MEYVATKGFGFAADVITRDLDSKLLYYMSHFNTLIIIQNTCNVVKA